MKNYLAWQSNMGDNTTGFSAYCMRQLGQIRELDVRYGIADDPDSKLYNDWNEERWHGGGVYWFDNELPFKNSWEYWFQNEITAEHIKINPSIQFIHSSGNYIEQYVPTPGTKAFRDKNELQIFGKLVEKYFIPSANVVGSLEPTIDKLKTLGVHCRRSTMGLLHPHAYLGYSDEVYFEKVMKVFNEGVFERIYLATEEYSIYQYFKQRVPELLLGIDNCFRVSSNVILETTLSNKAIRPLHAYTSGLEVLCDILNLSKCNSLLCFLSGVTSMACYFNNNRYNEVYYFDELK